jgi:hypothetical protein
MFGSNREDVTGDWKKLCNEELYDVYFSSGIFEVINQEDEIGRALACMGERREIQGCGGET